MTTEVCIIAIKEPFLYYFQFSFLLSSSWHPQILDYINWNSQSSCQILFEGEAGM